MFLEKCFWNLLFLLTSTFIGADGLLDKSKHQTNASMERMNELSCFECDSINAGIKCANLSLHNRTMFRTKCKATDKTCAVHKYSYITSSGNSTAPMRQWALKRKCAEKCEEGCIIIGERTKLHACTACCKENLCNITNAVTSLSFLSWKLLCSIVFMVVK